MAKTGTEIRLSGSGGQGLITAGIILAKAAILDKKHVTQTQSYGPESRGGSSRSDVIISNADIHYPEATSFDILLSLTQEAADKFSYDLADHGIFIIDTTHVKNVSIITRNLFEEAFSDIAMQELGTELPTNILSLSYMVKISACVTEKSLEKAIAETVKPAYKDLNIKAMKLGLKLAAAELKEREKSNDK